MNSRADPSLNRPERARLRMQTVFFNPQKMRLEIVEIRFTEANTTWFHCSSHDRDIYSITDYDGGLVITECNYNYPLWIYGVSRASIGYSRNRAFKLLKSCRRQYR